MKNKPYWIHYAKWEDYLNNITNNRNDECYIKKSFDVLTSPNLYEYMTETSVNYPISTKVNFTNKMFNPVSWLGQATCNYFCNSTAKETVQAWFLMSKEQQDLANQIAKQVINEWRNKNENI